jgi:arabinogalactan oligomer/maltooligosaccharide transport system substrate-binding protein
MNFKKILGVVLASSSLLFFTACSNNAADDSKNEKIVIWTRMENEVEVLQKYGKQFEDETGISVDIVGEAPDVQKLAQAVNSPSGPDGLFGIPNDQLGSFIAANLVSEVPKERFSDSEFVEAANKATYYNKSKYAIPISVETTTLFYNTELIENAPENWDELIKNSKDKGGIQFEATSIYYDYGFIRAYGGYIFKDNDGEVDTNDVGLNNEGSREGYKFIKKLQSDYDFFDSTITNDIAKSNFQDGKTAFFIGGPWDMAGFDDANVPYNVAIMPTLNEKSFITPVGTQVGFVTSKTKKSEKVWDFYEYLLKNASEELFTKGSRIPALLSAQEKIDADEKTQVFMKQIENSEPLPTTPALGQVWTPFIDNMKLLLDGKVTEEEAGQLVTEQILEGVKVMEAEE